MLETYLNDTGDGWIFRESDVRELEAEHKKASAEIKELEDKLKYSKEMFEKITRFGAIENAHDFAKDALSKLKGGIE